MSGRVPPAHDRNRKTFQQLSGRQPYSSIQAMANNLRRAVKAYARNNPHLSYDTHILRVVRILTRK